MDLFVSVKLEAEESKNQKTVENLILLIKKNKELNNFNKVIILFINFEKNIKYIYLKNLITRDIKLYFLSIKSDFSNYEDYFNFTEESGLFFQCEKIMVIKKNINNIESYNIDEIFDIKNINFLDKNSYIDKYQDNKYRTLRISFFKMIKASDVVFLTETPLSKKLFKNEHVSSFNKSINYFNFRTTQTLTNQFDKTNLYKVFISGLVVKTYVELSARTPEYYRKSIHKIIKFCLGRLVNIVIFYENERVQKGAGFIKISQYYVTKITAILLIKKFFYFFNFYNIYKK